MTSEEMEALRAERRACLQLLEDTDWRAIRFAEGEQSPEDYEPMRLKRRAWRARINEIEATIDVEVG